MKCYYAHPINTYGTQQEAEDISLLESFGLEVINPADENARSMRYFCNLVQECDCLAFRSFQDGMIGAGVAAEIEVMHGPVFELGPTIFNRKLTIRQTKQRLKYMEFED